MALTPRQVKAVAALLDSANRSNEAAAAAAGVGKRTLQDYLSDPDFQAELQAAQSAMIGEATRRLTSLCGLAVDALAECLGPYTNEKTAMQAATIVLDRVLRFVELTTLEQRLAALESSRDNP